MLASLQEPPVTQPGLVYEPKYDGIRAIVEIQKRLRESFPAVTGNDSRSRSCTRATATTRRDSFRPSRGRWGRWPGACGGPWCSTARSWRWTGDNRPLGFQHIQGRIHRTSDGDIANAERDQPAVLVLFDLLRDGDEDLRGLPLAARRLRLQERIKPRGAERDLHLAERDRPRRRPRDASAREAGRLGRAHRQERAVHVSQRQADAGVAQAQDPQAAGVRRRRLDRAASVAPAFRLAARRLLRRGRRAALGGIGRDRLRSEGTGSRRWTAESARNRRRARSTIRSRPASRRTGSSRHSSSRSGSRSGRATACCDSRSISALARTRRRARCGGRTRSPSQSRRCPRAAVFRSIIAMQRCASRKTRPTSGRSRRPRWRWSRGSTNSRTRARTANLNLPNGDRLRVTNLAKVFWPELGITKGELLRYYVQVSPLSASGRGRSAARHEAFPERRWQSRRSISSGIRSRRRRACAVRSCPSTSNR